MPHKIKSKTLIIWPSESRNLYIQNSIPKKYKKKRFTPYNLLFADSGTVVHFHWIEYLFVCDSILDQIKFRVLMILIFYLKQRGSKVVYTFHNATPNHERVHDWTEYVCNYNSFLSKIDKVILLNPSTKDVADRIGIILPDNCVKVWHGFLYNVNRIKSDRRQGFGVFGSKSSYKNNALLSEIIEILRIRGKNIQFYGTHWNDFFPLEVVVDEHDVSLEEWLLSIEFICVTNTNSLNSGVIWHSLEAGANIVISDPILKKSVPKEFDSNIFEWKSEPETFVPVCNQSIDKYSINYKLDCLTEIYDGLLTKSHPGAG